MNEWYGSYGIMLTPFAKSGKVDFAELEKQVDKLCQSEIDGIIVCGSSSEFLFCSPEENKEIMRVASDVSQNRKRIIGGASSPGRDMTKDYLEYMASVGIDSALISPPYYYKYTDEEIAEFYREISDMNLGIDIIAYNIPFFSNAIGESAFNALLECENVRGVKNSGQNIKEISNQVQLRDSHRKDFAILTGTEEAFFPCLAAGCNGAFTAFGGLLPDNMKGIYTLFCSGEYKLSKELQDTLLPLLRLCSNMTFPVGYKLFGKIIGNSFDYIPQSLSSRQIAELPVIEQHMRDEYEKVSSLWEAQKEYIEQLEIKDRKLQEILN